MKIVKVTVAICFLILFLVTFKVFNFRTSACSESGQYQYTYSAKIEGIVSEIVLGKNLFGVVVDGDKKESIPLLLMKTKCQKDLKRIILSTLF